MDTSKRQKGSIELPDLNAAKSQAVVLKRIIHRLEGYVLATTNDGSLYDHIDHLKTEISYLMDYLAMTEEER